MRTKSILIGLAATTLALPGVSLALGLGKLTVQSSLGQPLVARIDFTSASSQELDSLTAKIADPSLYSQNNLTYQGVLSRGRVNIERTANGAYLTVTTQSPLNEPYLDLMVELNWAQGRLVREYTFLLDPPGVTAPPVEPVTPLRGGAAPSVVSPVAAAPVSPPRAAAAPSTAPSMPPSSPARAAGAGDSYTVQRGDTLSRIAAEHKPANVTLEQMLVAMYKHNPSAFDGNINRLRA